MNTNDHSTKTLVRSVADDIVGTVSNRFQDALIALLTAKKQEQLELALREVMISARSCSQRGDDKEDRFSKEKPSRIERILNRERMDRPAYAGFGNDER